jgi:signal peptidase I
MHRATLKKALRETAVLGFMLVGILAARSTLADHYYVPSGSMEPTLLPGDRVLVDKRAHGIRLPFTTRRLFDGESIERGEIVIFDSPHDGKRLIKRIVAVGGDAVVVRDGHLFINGESMALTGDPLLEGFGERLARLNLLHGGGPNYRRVIPPGMLLAVGDHRGRSFDGRMFGLIAETDVYGRALGVYYRRGDGLTWLTL